LEGTGYRGKRARCQIRIQDSGVGIQEVEEQGTGGMGDSEFRIVNEGYPVDAGNHKMQYAPAGRIAVVQEAASPQF
jgi:hypothetical protein